MRRSGFTCAEEYLWRPIAEEEAHTSLEAKSKGQQRRVVDETVLCKVLLVRLRRSTATVAGKDA
ncbi:hypothetical protein Syun_012495 [Stephania yunnanensis]|uniref:Uncharacterized protein n=1 Tax=Stephania yunnanensis TaxID=152371 RepID=A0AAP0PJ12_9MAGN